MEAIGLVFSETPADCLLISCNVVMTRNSGSHSKASFKVNDSALPLR